MVIVIFFQDIITGFNIKKNWLFIQIVKAFILQPPENLNAMHDLLSIMKHQNELLNNANKKLKDEISEFKDKYVVYPTRKRKSKP